MTSSLPLSRMRRRYGAGPLHLSGHLLLIGAAGFAIDRIASTAGLATVIALYLGLTIAHDLVLLPAYAGIDRLTQGLLRRAPARAVAGVPVINHLRAPALISGLLLLIYAPLISGRADHGYLLASGHHATGYLRNWVLISGALFLASGVLYALRVRRAAARG